MITIANPVARARLQTALGAASLVALVWCGYEAVSLGRLSAPLEPTMVRLQLAASASDAADIRHAWDCHAATQATCRDVTPIARRALVQDSWLVAAYVTALVLLGVWAGWSAGLSRRVTGVVAGLVIVAGACDLAENWCLGITLGDADRLPFARVAPFVPGLVDYARATANDYAHAVTLARLAAMTKLSLLLVGVAVTLALAGGELRRAVVCRLLAAKNGGKQGPGCPDEKTTSAGSGFEALVGLENTHIFDPENRPADDPVIVDHVAADEPRIGFRAADVIGLALSGGGIRSATFNLGLLQGLHRMRLLKLFDYVSTVSGGGYLGSFWSEWLARQSKDRHGNVAEEHLFPTFRDPESASECGVDTDAERHLREFSGFLAPRWGFLEVETWGAIAAVLSGLLPALLIGLSVIGILLSGWLVLNSGLGSAYRWLPLPAIVLVTAVALGLGERVWRDFNRQIAAYGAGDPATVAWSPPAQWTYVIVAVLATGAVGVVQWLLPVAYETFGGLQWPVWQGRDWAHLQASDAVAQWWVLTGIANHGGSWIFSSRLFDFGLTWLASAVLLVGARLACSTWLDLKRESLAAFDRVLLRLLALGVAWCGLAAVWHVSINLSSLVAAAVAAIASAISFAALRNWIGVALRRPAEAGVLERLTPYLLPALAYLTIALAAIVTGGLLIRIGHDDWLRWWTSASVMTGVIIVGLFIRTGEFGLHAFYRDRISRAYAGACNLAEGKLAGNNRWTEPQEHDDRPMDQLVGRPLHLVCCAANDLRGDQVETLGRGARSAVLSRHGFALGRHFQPWTAVSVPSLGAAVTASAAAFNSNMGHISVRLGPAVSFVMSMLNLRLGLWRRHPAAPAPQPRRWPGLLFYREMFALTSASGWIPKGTTPPTFRRDVHLSDGGHFENLALYELIRRHCRYIVVSDCGADPQVAFDDLGNALRRIREDFGVEITVDVSPLRPGKDGVSRQHVAVGTIHYSATDHGILLYVKPTVTGDESPDVLQYKAANGAFPHERTLDQFYDEAQWESYRRLGLHAAETIFEFVARQDDSPRVGSADWVFAEAGHRWSPTPEGLADRVLEMNQRFGVLEAELRQPAARALFEEVFPELALLSVPPGGGVDAQRVVFAGRGAAVGATTSVDAVTRTAFELSLLLRVVQLMEDVWVACELDRWWTHPLNLGWMNLFARWATSSRFRLWWPLLAPMYGPGFREFIQERFPAPAGRVAGCCPQQGRVEPLSAPESSGLAALWWQERSAQPRNWRQYDGPPFARVLYQDVLDLPTADGGHLPVQVGIAGVTRHGHTVGWTSDDFFVPPSLWGTGIGWYFLDALLALLSRGAAWCYVVIKMPPKGKRQQTALDDRQVFVNQYRKAGFREERRKQGAWHCPVDEALCRTLGYVESEDTLLVLDLDRWSRPRDSGPEVSESDVSPWRQQVGGDATAVIAKTGR